MGKIIVSAQGQTLDDPVDPRFGRAAYFLVIDPETMTFEVLDNSAGRSMGQGAGIQAAEVAARTGAKVILSGFVGPKAFQGLSTAGIKIGQGVEGMTVRQAVQRYKDGLVEMTASPTKPGHWG